MLLIKSYAVTMSTCFDMIEEMIKKIDSASNLEELNSLQIDLISKNGLITKQFHTLQSITDQAERYQVIQKLSNFKSEILNKIKKRQDEIKEQIMLADIKKEYTDISLPSCKVEFGKIHPISKMIQEILHILSKFGFQIIHEENMENDWYNFSGLNIPKNHPSRQMHDTFYLKQNTPTNNHDDANLLLRTHTSNMQIKFMQQHKPPFRFISYGKTYRSDSDSTHVPMFHQIECVVVSENSNFANMKFLLSHLLQELFGKEIKIRFRPNYFPFTSPSCEIDAMLPNTNKWLELLGCGMIHEQVLINSGIDPKKWQGFACGMGIDRLAMIKYGIKDIRHYFEGNLEWLKHYGFYNI